MVCTEYSIIESHINMCSIRKVAFDPKIIKSNIDIVSLYYSNIQTHLYEFTSLQKSTVHVFDHMIILLVYIITHDLIIDIIACRNDGNKTRLCYRYSKQSINGIVLTIRNFIILKIHEFLNAILYCIFRFIFDSSVIWP